MRPPSAPERSTAGARLPPVVSGTGVSLEIPVLRRLDVHAFRAPIDSPVRTSFGVMTERPAVVVRVEDQDGAAGWGEIWCNFPACGAEHRGRLAASVLAPGLLGRRFASPVCACDMMVEDTRILALQSREFGPLAQAMAGVDLALWDLVARRAGQPLYQLLGGRQTPCEVPTYASGINPDTAVDAMARARDSGFSAFKVKIGFDPHGDRRVAAAVAESLGTGERFMVDANQAWTLEQALDQLPTLAKTGVHWLEEPLPADAPAGDWQALARASAVAIAAGENLASSEAFVAAADAGYLQVIQPDICKWGGISRCVPVARYVLQAGLRYCPHYLGGGIGLLASAHVLAAVGGDGLLEVDVNPNPLRDALTAGTATVKQGMMTLPDGPGIGVEPPLHDLTPWRTLHLIERT